MSKKLCLGYTEVNVCEHVYTRSHKNFIDIQCRLSETIKIIAVWYGRKSRKICPHGDMSNLSCSSNPAASLRIAKRTCQNKQHCTLRASNAVFGDPCRGIEKYLALKYNCRPSKSSLQIL